MFGCNKINKENFLKYLDNPLQEIEYFYTGKDTKHYCSEPKDPNENIKNKTNDINNINNDDITNTNNKELMKSLIFSNIDKNLSFHLNNLKNNNIIIKKFCSFTKI